MIDQHAEHHDESSVRRRDRFFFWGFYLLTVTTVTANAVLDGHTCADFAFGVFHIKQLLFRQPLILNQLRRLLLQPSRFQLQELLLPGLGRF